jgi:hypothetical protein
MSEVHRAFNQHTSRRTGKSARHRSKQPSPDGGQSSRGGDKHDVRRGAEVNKKRKKRARSRHRPQCVEKLHLSRSTEPKQRLRTRYTAADGPERVQALLGDCGEDTRTVSATFDPDMERESVIELLAWLPGGRRKLFGGRLDLGCLPNLMNERLARRLKLRVRRTKKLLKLRGVSRFTEVTRKKVKLSFSIEPYPREFKVWFWILSEECMVNDALFGCKFLDRYGIERNDEVWRAITRQPTP